MSDHYEHKENTGSVFKNDKKESERHPDYKGSAKIDGVDYWISAWINETTDKKKKYLKLAFETQREQAVAPSGGSGEAVEDIPF